MMGAERQAQEQMIHKMEQFENIIYDTGRVSIITDKM